MIVNFTKKQMSYLVICITLMLPLVGWAQDDPEVLESASLDEIVDYALKHQPVLQQAKIDQQITEKQIKGKLADWYPQVNFDYNYQYWSQLMARAFQGNIVTLGIRNLATAQFSVTQNLFDPNALLAGTTASTVRVQSEQNIKKSKIDLVVNVSKAFYDVLATMQQIRVSEESVVRLKQSVENARNRYNSGISDKTDYQRARIALSNAETQLRTNREMLGYKEQVLKALMGYPNDNPLPLQYDWSAMEEQVQIDTTQTIMYNNHIDYQLIQTQKELQKANLSYSKWAFVPTINASAYYSLYYLNSNFNELYSSSSNHPYSYFSLSMNFPIFQGNKRIAKVQEQRLASDRLDEGIRNLKNNLSTEYTRSMATYKSNLYNFNTQKENTELAEEVYHVISLQYQNGVKTYLDMIVAETDLRTSRINYYNALYQVLASKMDVQRALGQINY